MCEDDPGEDYDIHIGWEPGDKHEESDEVQGVQKDVGFDVFGLADGGRAVPPSRRGR